MAIVKLGKVKSLFKNKLEIPKTFLNNCKNDGNQYYSSMHVNDNFIILCNNSSKEWEFKNEILSISENIVNKSDFTIKLVKKGGFEQYRDVTGFFEFRGTLYYKAPGASAKSLDEYHESFTDSLIRQYEWEFKGANGPKIGSVKVVPLELLI